MISVKSMIGIGLALDFFGAVILLRYSWKTTGGTTRADKDYMCSPWWQRTGYLLIALGFLAQLWGYSFG